MTGREFSSSSKEMVLYGGGAGVEHNREKLSIRELPNGSVQDVKELCLAYMQIYYKNLHTKDGLWISTRNEYPSLVGKIDGLRDSFIAAAKVEGAYDNDNYEYAGYTGGSTGRDVIKEATEIFGKVEEGGWSSEDRYEKELLGRIFLKRLSLDSGELDEDINSQEEAELMVQELGVEDGLGGEGIKLVTMDDVVERVLIGDLKLETQTKRRTN